MRTFGAGYSIYLPNNWGRSYICGRSLIVGESLWLISMWRRKPSTYSKAWSLHIFACCVSHSNLLYVACKDLLDMFVSWLYDPCLTMAMQLTQGLRQCCPYLSHNGQKSIKWCLSLPRFFILKFRLIQINVVRTHINLLQLVKGPSIAPLYASRIQIPNIDANKLMPYLATDTLIVIWGSDCQVGSFSTQNCVMKGNSCGKSQTVWMANTPSLDPHRHISWSHEAKR